MLRDSIHPCGPGFRLAVLLAIAVLLLSLPAASSASFPGERTDSSLVNYSPILMQQALRSYYALHGKWPASWEAVKQAGLFSGTLLTPEGREINPDDARLDFACDLYYKPAAAGESRGLVVGLPGSGTTRVKHYWIDPVKSYRELLSGNDCLNGLRAEHGRLEQTAHLQLIIGGLANFEMVKDRLPESMTELFASGLCVFSTAPINPVTGGVYKFDGSAGDFVVNLEAVEGVRPLRVWPVMLNGSVSPCGIAF